MKNNSTVIYRTLLVSALLGAYLTTATARGQETNTLEIIRQLQSRIDALEQKLKAIEDDKERAAQTKTNEVKATQQIEELNLASLSCSRTRLSGTVSQPMRRPGAPYALDSEAQVSTLSDRPAKLAAGVAPP